MQNGKLLLGPEELDHDESRGCYRLQGNWANERPSTVAVVTVAAAAETDPLDLPPLHETVDPDALDDLFRETPGGRPRESGRVEFTLADHRVVVDTSGEIEVYPPA